MFHEPIETPDDRVDEHFLDLRHGTRVRRLTFASEEDRRRWVKASRKRRLYVSYFLVGVGINAVLYLMGVDLSRNFALGLLVGMGVPITCMFLLSEVHYRLFIDRRE